MKKLFMMFAASVMLCMAACSGDKSGNAESDAETAPAPETTMSPAQINSIAGKEYIANLQKEDSAVMVTPSGLGYKVIAPGEGATPDATSNVKVIYSGRHINGQEFDNSLGEAVGFNLQGVVPGFTEGIMLMNKGAKYELYIPGEMAYGPQGRPDAGIRPNELLIFEVELVDFQ